jgi:hypothetical protein
MHRYEARDGQPGLVKIPYWMLVALVTLYALYVGIFGEQTLWLQAVPVVLAALMAALPPRSQLGLVAFVVVGLLMVYVCWMRTYGGL